MPGMWTTDESMSLRVHQTDGKTPEEIAVLMGKTAQDVRNKLISMGYKPHTAKAPAPTRKKKGHYHCLGAKDLEEVERMASEGYTARQIAEKFAISVGVTRRYVRDMETTGTTRYRGGVYHAKVLGPLAAEKKQELLKQPPVIMQSETPRSTRAQLLKKARADLEKAAEETDFFDLGRVAGILDVLIEMEGNDDAV